MKAATERPGRDLPIGGQAVMEGVMMRGVSTWAVACRAPDGEIEVHSEPLVSWMGRRRIFRLPLVRGVVALAESLKIGFRALNISANVQIPADQGESDVSSEIDAGDGPGASAKERSEGLPRKVSAERKIGGTAWGLTVLVALAVGVGLFFVLPLTIANTMKEPLGSPFLFWLVEGVIRVAIFLAYLAAVSLLPDLKRVFQYHGAEHKTIACYEAGDDLRPDRARHYSRFHIRCGTSFLLIVMIVAVFVFAAVGTPPLGWMIVSRIVGVPVIAGISYEIVRWAARNRQKPWVYAAMWPGLQLQRLTTREPANDQIAVAIASLKSVLSVENPKEASDADRVGMEVVA